MKRAATDMAAEPQSPTPSAPEGGGGGRRRRSTRTPLRRYQEIDHVRVEEIFPLKEPATRGSKKVGDAAYVTATINNRRFYGTLIDQDALKSASLLYFQDTAASLEVNRRMKIMKQRQTNSDDNDDTTAKNEPPSCHAESKTKEEEGQQGDAATPMNVCSSDGSAPPLAAAAPARKEPSADAGDGPSVQKFRFVEGSAGENNSEYRVLLATYSSVEAAAEDDTERAMAIETACRSGGNFVGKYYYQYETLASSLECDEPESTGTATRGLRMSMGFHAFLQSTLLPEWYPLSNLEGVGQAQVLDTLGMKKDTNGMLVWDQERHSTQAVKEEDIADMTTPLIPMEPRSRYRVVVVGGGIAGLSCCLELFQVCERDGVDVEVVLVEGRERLGGRLWTDRETFRSKETGAAFPVDLGASWIHGIDSNPLAAMAQEANIDFIRTSEEVTMLREGGRVVDEGRDEQAGELFDKLLDMAVETCWRDADGVEDSGGPDAVRWYASVFNPSADENMSSSVTFVKPRKTPVGQHRNTSDTSVDEAIGKVISKGRLSEIASLSVEETRMLNWNVENIEYALGANISDLSMKFWDIDERHAFEGDHVILRQGYSCIVDHIYGKLEKRGERFRCLKGSPVQRIEYARKTTRNPYFSPTQRHKRFVELSDTCQVVFEGSAPGIPCDFVVSAVPLGVLKDSIQENGSSLSSKLSFEPGLPFSKKDSIESVGFGLLDKVYLQFSHAFWRKEHVLKEGQTSFGNASACNPHHYMFIDIGLSLFGQGISAPPILMTLISGVEAVASECLSEEGLVAEVVRTLRTLFDEQQVPDPVSHKVTRWGRDRFSRGSYTYLPPGTTDQDFRVLQSPINGNGDSILLDGSETMRCFFAGEHTTSLHPSMAHGALLSGYRAAKEVVEAMVLSFGDASVDRTIPLSIFRHMNPKANLTCVLCHLSGSRVREGSLLAFKRGSREALVHSNCAENSPEVGVKDSAWSNVIKACNRGKAIECSLCCGAGATIGCSVADCSRSFHFSCAEDTGWRFDDDGKEFICDRHRPPIAEQRKISLEFYLTEAEDGSSLTCALCGSSNDRGVGELLAFQKGNRRIVVHENCLRFTSTVKVVENTSSRFEKDFENVFDVVDSSRTCGRCSRGGATIECSEPSCKNCYHLSCARSLDWNSAENRHFRCLEHRRTDSSLNQGNRVGGEGFQHALFSLLGAEPSVDVPANLDTGTMVEDVVMEEDPPNNVASPPVEEPNHFQTEKLGEYEGDVVDVRLVNAVRESPKHKWGLMLQASKDSSGKRILSIADNDTGTVEGLKPGDVVFSMNGTRVGTPALDTIEKALKILSQEVEVLMEVCDGAVPDDVWGT